MSTPVYPYPQFPPQGQPQITSRGLLQNQLYYLLQALFRRTGSGSGLANTVGTVTATGSNQSTAVVLTNDYNNVTGGNGGVQLANLQPSQFQQVVNNTAAVINIYPTPGGQIQGSAVNAPVTLGIGLQQTFTGYSVNTAGAAVYQSDTAIQGGGNTNWIQAGGTADGITAAYVPPIVNLSDGQLFFFRATNANNTTTPTFSPNGLTPRTITRHGGQPLSPKDIPGPVAEVILRYNAPNTRYEILNPAQAHLIVSIQTFTVSGTYTPHANLLYAIVTVIGAGGGAGASTGSAAGVSSGGGGGGGGGARDVLSAAQIGANQTVTIGAHGVGATSAGASGTPGTATSFGTLVVAGGGGAGVGAAINSFAAGGAGGTGTTGSVKFPGSAGTAGLGATITSVQGISGWGGAPPFIGIMTPGVFNANGSVGACPGAGGSGGQSFANAGASNGGNGADGFVEVIEYSFAV